MATTKKTALDPNMTCRGKWSACGGTEPSISAKWHLGAACTKKRADAMKKTAAEIKPPKATTAPKAAIKSAKPATPARKPAPRPTAPVQRVAAVAAPTPTITKAEQDAERRGDRNN